MADQDFKNTPADNRSKTSNNEPARSEPKIRTMQSDVAEYVKKTKPSLLELVTKHGGAQERFPETEVRHSLPARLIVVLFLAFVGVAIGGWLGYRYLISQPGPVAPEEPQGPVPASPISFEKTEILNVTANISQLRQALSSVGEASERTGSFTRILLRVKEVDGSIRFLTAEKFFEILDVNPPEQVLSSLGPDLFLYVYYGGTGPRSVFIAPSRNSGRTFSGMLAWENSLQRDLETLFLEYKPDPVIAPFIDKTIKNVDYRYLSIEPDLGIGYLIFSGKNYLVMTTSEETLEVVINRLFEAR